MKHIHRFTCTLTGDILDIVENAMGKQICVTAKEYNAYKSANK